MFCLVKYAKCMCDTASRPQIKFTDSCKCNAVYVNEHNNMLQHEYLEHINIDYVNFFTEKLVEVNSTLQDKAQKYKPSSCQIYTCSFPETFTNKI